MVVKMKSGKITVPYDVEIGVIDYNNNGLFNDSGIDKFFIPNIEKDTLDPDDCLSWTSVYYPEIQFMLDKKLFALEKVDPKGNYATVRLLPDAADTLAKIKLVSNIFNLDFDKIEQGADGLKNTFRDNEYSMIKMWFTKCGGCIREIPEVKKLRKKYGIAVVGFNAIDSDFEIQKHISDHDIPWKQYKVEKDLLKSLGNDCSYPYNILIDKEGRVLLKEGKVENIAEYLERRLGR
ncbi:MAG TPA: redoxin domain-containing protein [Bacteroidetes bacterium]|nr:redoxin domain-containing protein [Bacteroidota bacterium]